ncbi:MAG: aspartate aminotransferase family protein [Gemmatimonadetes bacterium]|nr:aspartate aminotransferase family protein [Gemmatimonadota bacterium]
MTTLAALDADLLSRYLANSPTSKAWYERACKVMPGGDTRTGTFHLPYPLFISLGQGCRLWDVDGNEYLDFLNNFTSLVHGHAHHGIQEALASQGTQGTVHGTANEFQVQLAELICRRVPSVERLRFCNSGTEASLFALRAAKAFTGRSGIMKMEAGYHGSHDQVSVAMVPPYETKAAQGLSPGAVGEVLLGKYNDLDYTVDAIRRNKDRLAAVIVEPMMGAGGGIVADQSFLAGLRAVTEACGIVLIFDEIITFRLGYGGMQGHLGIRPDLTCFGKIIGGGLPVGAFGGRADIMDAFNPTRSGGIVHSGTYNGNAATMVAGLKAMELLSEPVIAQLNQRGDGLRARLNQAATKLDLDVTVVGFGSLMQVHFARGPLRGPQDAARGDKEAVRALHLYLLTHGIFAPSRLMLVLSTAMSEDAIDTMAATVEDGLTAIGQVARPQQVLA